MNNRVLVATMALSLSILTVSPALASPVLGPNGPATTTLGTVAKGKAVSFTVRNATAQPLTIQAGDQQYTVAPGKETKLKLQSGTQLMNVNALSTYAAGQVLGTVDSSLSGNTLVIN